MPVQLSMDRCHRCGKFYTPYEVVAGKPAQICRPCTLKLGEPVTLEVFA
jgi:hypothetical protein